MIGRDEDLDYVSSSPLLGAPVETNPTDESDLPALEALSVMLQDQINSYSTIDQLDLTDKNFTVEQQLAINKRVQSHLQELKLVIDTVVENVKEKYR